MRLHDVFYEAGVVPDSDQLTMVKTACWNAARAKSLSLMAYGVWQNRRTPDDFEFLVLSAIRYQLFVYK